MANVQVFQRHAHLAGAVKLEFVNGREGKIAKGVLTAISNTRRGSGDSREEESTAIQWTLWGKQAENAAEYLGKGSHVNIVGRLRNNNYEKDGETVYGMAFTAEEIDYLDSRAERERLLLMTRKLYRFASLLMVPALAFGVWLWLGYGVGARQGWLHLKLVLVLAAVGYHFTCRTLMHGFEQMQNRRSHRWFRVFNEVSVLVFAAIVVLVVVKPF